MRFVAVIAGIVGAAIVSVPLCVMLITTPAFTRLVEDNANQESVRVASHLAASLYAEDGAISRERLPKEFPAEAEKVRQDFSLLRLRVLAPSGEIIFSTKTGESGNFNRQGYFLDKVLHGSIHSIVVRHGQQTLEGETVQTDVAETYVPLIRKGQIVGAFEIYYDISERIANLEQIVRRVNFLLFAAVAILLTITAALLLRARKSQTERDLAREEWASTFDAVTDPIMIVTREFVIARVNKAMAEWLAVSPKDAVGLTCYQQVHHCNEPAAGCPHKKLLQDGMAHSVEIYDDRSSRYFSVSVYPVFSSAGNLSGSVHYAKDITTSKKAEEELHRAKTKYRIIADNTYAWEFWLGPDSSYLYISPSCERMTGYTPEEFTADPDLFQRIIHPADRQHVMAQQRAMVNQEITSSEGLLFRIIRREGVVSWIAQDCRPIFDADGGYLGIRGSNSDVTERKRSEALIQQQLKNMTALSDIGMAISSTLDTRVTLNILLDRLISLLGIDAATVLLMDQESLYLKCDASIGFSNQSIRKTRVKMGKGHAGRAAFERRIQIIPDLSDTLTNSLKEEKFSSYVAVPLLAQGKVVGVMELFHRTAIDPSPEWLDFLELMAAQAAIAIDNATLFHNLQRTNAELILSYDATLEGWGRTLEFRDEDTKGHTNRVAGMAVQFAHLMGLDEREIVHLRRGAMLHDIGKISIPDAILLKPGPLNPEEREIMQRHPIYAYEFLKPIPFLRAALDIPYCHHEKWDGSGTPRGLKGEEIPLFARIFSVVDVWDALMSDRPYRPAWPLLEVKEYIQARSGIEFDPQVVEIFLRYLDDEECEDIWSIREQKV